MGLFSILPALLLAFLCVPSTAIPTISAIGSKFFTSDGNQFFIKGKFRSTTGRLAIH